jgi:hypothetical protein
MPLVYDELRRVARAYLRREREDHTLQATALVHEAYLHLVDDCTARNDPAAPRNDLSVRWDDLPVPKNGSALPQVVVDPLC